MAMHSSFMTSLILLLMSKQGFNHRLDGIESMCNVILNKVIKVENMQSQYSIQNDSKTNKPLAPETKPNIKEDFGAPHCYKINSSGKSASRGTNSLKDISMVILDVSSDDEDTDIKLQEHHISDTIGAIETQIVGTSKQPKADNLGLKNKKVFHTNELSKYRKGKSPKV